MQFKKQKEILGHAGAIYSGAVKDSLIYTGSADKYLVRWLSEEGTQDKFSIRFDQSIYAIEFIANNRLIAGLSSGGMHVFDLNDRKELKYYTQHTKAVFAIRRNAEKQHFYAGDADGNLSVWDENTLELLIYLPLDCGKIRDICVSSNGDQFVLACQDGTLRVFESNFFNEIKTIDAHKGGSTSVIYHPLDEEKLISGGKDALLKSWNLPKEEELESIPAHNFAIYSIVPIGNGTHIATASRDKTIKIWGEDLSFKQRIDHKDAGHRHSVNQLLKVDENTFASISDDKKIIIWERTTEN
jgi:WD40 repeat protein